MKLFKLLFTSVFILLAPAVFGEENWKDLELDISDFLRNHSSPGATFRQSILSAPGPHDRAVDLVDTLQFTELSKIDQAGLNSASLTEQPWSDSYWPIYQGALANRYADSDFPASSDWKENSDYIDKNIGVATSLDNLSPAEKYDLLVGDKNFTLTKTQMAEGKPYYDRDKKVETWMGLCHGWAAASYMMGRPKKTVTVLAADGITKIKFYPSDIKALSTLLWATSNTRQTRFIGGRCNDKDPANDDLGRPKDQDCLDNNPGTWHLVVVNQIGVSKRSFVLDATYNYEVWNQPAYSYKIKYFNLLTKQEFDLAELAMIKIQDYAQDPYKTVRAAGTKYLVGVRMELSYMSETSPSHEIEDTPQEDYIHTVNYNYDLELNDKTGILGGEWHSNAHPDFLWTPTKGSVAKSTGDIFLDRALDTSIWDPLKSVPATWQKIAPRSSQYSQPLSRVVYQLTTLAQLGLE